MTNVTKRSGEMQAFDPGKLVESMVRAGASQPVAEAIAKKVQGPGGDGMRTIDVRRRVAVELRKVNEAVAEAYERTLRLPVKARDDVETGRARVPKLIERLPDVLPGQPARVRFGERRAEVRIEPALDRREVWLNPIDFQALGAPEGARIAVRFLEPNVWPIRGDTSARPRLTTRFRV